MSSEPTCPLGFGSGAVRSSPMECGLCRGLLFDPVRLEPCGCNYCHDCGARVRDCLKCGRDVSSMVRDPERDAQVTVFVAAHKAPEGHRALGMFWLEHALKHRAQQNKWAADARLTEAARSFQVAEAWEERAVALSTQSVLRGSELGDPESAAELFALSVKTLEEKCPEAFMTRAVAETKFAVFEHQAGRRESAETRYRRALEARKKARSTRQCGDEDVASSMLGLATILSDLGRQDEAVETASSILSLLEESSDSERGKSIRDMAQEIVRKQTR